MKFIPFLRTLKLYLIVFIHNKLPSHSRFSFIVKFKYYLRRMIFPFLVK